MSFGGGVGSLCTVKHHFARQAAAGLLKFAKATSDPQVAAALVEKAADLKDRLDGLPRRRFLTSSIATRRPRRTMTRDSDSLRLSISVVLTALLLGVLSLGSLIFAISN